MFRKQIAIAAGALSLIVAALPTPASAQDPIGTGQYGVAQPGVTTCRVGRMDVTAPNIEPLSVGIIGGYQLTGFVSVLKRWNPALRRWLTVRRSLDYLHQADGIVIPPENFSYYDPVARVWRTRTQGPSFSMAGRHGYFTVTHEFYWLDNFSGQGTNRPLGRLLVGTREIFDERAGSYGRTRGFCFYR